MSIHEYSQEKVVRALLVVRYDDFSARSSTTLERAILGVLDRLGASMTVGAIPAVWDGFTEVPLGPEKGQLLREGQQMKRWHVATHGWNHKALCRVCGIPGEFVRLKKNEYDKRLRQAADIFRDHDVAAGDTFIPPWNHIDRAAYEVLAEHGFTTVSASLRGPFYGHAAIAEIPYTVLWSQLDRTVSIACRLGGGLPAIGHAVRDTDAKIHGGKPEEGEYGVNVNRHDTWAHNVYAVVLLLHDFDFCESGHTSAHMTVAEFEKGLIDLIQRYRIRVVSLSELARCGFRVDVAQMRLLGLWNRVVAKLPWRLRRLLEGRILRLRRGHKRPMDVTKIFWSLMREQMYRIFGAYS